MILYLMISKIKTQNCDTKQDLINLIINNSKKLNQIYKNNDTIYIPDDLCTHTQKQKKKSNIMKKKNQNSNAM